MELLRKTTNSIINISDEELLILKRIIESSNLDDKRMFYKIYCKI